MHRLHLSRHALPAVLAIAVSLLAPLLAAGGPVTATEGSAPGRPGVGVGPHKDVRPAEPPSTRFAPDGPAMTTARQIAESHWGTAPCNGQVTVVWSSLDASTNATAAWRNPTDAWNNVRENFDCRIDFNANSDFDWPKFCTVMTHEIGHLLGNQHSDVPRQLMSPVYTEPLPVCTGAEPGAPAPATPAPATVAAPVAQAPATRAAAPADAATALKATPKKQLRATPKKVKKAKKGRSVRRCSRGFRAGRRAARCTDLQRQMARATRALR